MADIQGSQAGPLRVFHIRWGKFFDFLLLIFSFSFPLSPFDLPLLPEGKSPQQPRRPA